MNWICEFSMSGDDRAQGIHSPHGRGGVQLSFIISEVRKLDEVIVGLARFELATNGLGNRCSIHLSYSPMRIG